MTELLLSLIALVWGIGACLRIYRQARFFQIEEYMNGRYLRWAFAERDRWLPRRPLMACFSAQSSPFSSAKRRVCSCSG